MAHTKRDSKDPMPTANNTGRDGKDGGGNTPVTGEKHDAAKAERVSAESRLSRGMGPAQPTRQNGDGNTTVSGESHNQAKAERISEDARW